MKIVVKADPIELKFSLGQTILTPFCSRALISLWSKTFSPSSSYATEKAKSSMPRRLKMKIIKKSNIEKFEMSVRLSNIRLRMFFRVPH